MCTAQMSVTRIFIHRVRDECAEAALTELDIFIIEVFFLFGDVMKGVKTNLKW